MGSLHPHRAETVDLAQAAAVGVAAASMSMPDFSAVAAWQPAGDEYRVGGDRPSMDGVSPMGEPLASFRTPWDSMAALSRDTPSPVGSHLFDSVFAAPQESFVAPVLPLITAIALDVQDSVVSVVVVDPAPPASRLSLQVENSGTYADAADGESDSSATASTGPTDVSHPAMLGKAAFDTPPPLTASMDMARGPRLTADVANIANVVDIVDVIDVLDVPPPASIGNPNHPAEFPASPFSKPEPSLGADVTSVVGNRKTDLSPNRDAAASAYSVSADGGLASSATINPQNQSAYRNNSMDTAATNSVEGGFVTLDDAIAAPQLNAPVSGATSDGSKDAADCRPFGDLSPGSSAVAGQTAGDSVHAGKPFASQTSGATFALAKGQSSRDADEGLIIDFADAAPAAPAAASDPAAAQDPSDVRLPSGAGLFCDMEVALGGSPGDAADSASQPADYAAATAAAPIRQVGPAARPPQETLRRAAPRRPASPPPLDNVPLFLGAAVIVLSGGIRASQSDLDRERRIRNIDRPQSQPRE